MASCELRGTTSKRFSSSACILSTGTVKEYAPVLPKKVDGSLPSNSSSESLFSSFSVSLVSCGKDVPPVEEAGRTARV